MHLNQTSIFLGPYKLQNHTNDWKEKEKNERARRKKGVEEKKAMVALLVFMIATSEIVFARKKTVGRPFGGDVLKYPVRYMCVCMLYICR